MSLIEQLQDKQWIKDLPASINAYIVGGCVRDMYMNRKSKDIDIVLENTNFNFISSYLHFYGKVDIVGESFGVIKFKAFGDNEDYDIALTRSERKINSGHKGFEVSTDNISINDDLSRRDFTINSIAINIKSGDTIDIFDGIQAINTQSIIVNREESFFEDPLRMLRAVQFALRFDFDIELDTLNLINKNAHLIKEISPERILIEFEKVRNAGCAPQTLLNLLVITGLYEHIFNTNKRWDFDLIQYNIDKKIKSIDAQSFYFMLLYDIPGGTPSSLYKTLLKGDNDTTKDIKAIEALWNFNYSNDIDYSNTLLGVYKILKKYDRLMVSNTWYIFRNNFHYKSLQILYFLNLFITGYYPNPNNPFINGDEIMSICNIDKQSKLVSDLFDKILIDIFKEKYSTKDNIKIKDHLIKYKNELT